MLKKILGALSAFLLVLGLGLAAASPAQAATYWSCQDNVTNEKGQLCFYDWIETNYASGFWQRSWSYIGNNVAGGLTGCVDLGPHNWHDRTAGSVNNEASSLILAGITTSSGGYRFEFYDLANCSTGPSGTGYFFTVVVGGSRPLVRRIPNLADLGTTCDSGYCNLNWANRIGSVRLVNN